MRYLGQIKSMLKMQNGRSMVEMLGVLAVVGVLSIGAIYGYRFAMDKYHANEIVHGVGMMAMSAQTQIEVTGDFTLDEFKNSDLLPYSFEEGFSDDDSFYITLKEVPQGACERLKSMAWQEPSAILINDVPDGVCDQEENSIEFSFNISEGESDVKKCASTDDCPYCNTCTGGKCVADTLCDNSCPPDKPILEKSGSCAACPTAFRDYTAFSADSASECSKCTFQGHSFVYRNGECVLSTTTCPEGYFYSYQASNCQSCTSGVYTHHQSHEENLRCVEACKGVRVLTDDGGWGESCDAPCTGDGYFYDSWGFCRKCEETSQYWGNCSAVKCPGITFSRYNYGDDCVIDCPNYGDNVGRCCNAEEVYTHIGTKRYGHPYGACCPKTRPTWNGSKCVP